jgi:hypothetical protein
VKTLVVCGDQVIGLAQKRRDAGVTLLAWTDGADERLGRAGVEHLARRDVLSVADFDAADEAAIEWTRHWGKTPLVDGKSFRELAVWKGVSLWWFAELYLHHSTGSTRRVRIVEAFSRILERAAPDEVEAAGLSAEETLLLLRTCTARGVLFLGDAPVARPGAAPRLRQSWWYLLKTLLTALKSWWQGPPLLPPPGRRRRVLFLSHAAFWKSRASEAGGPEAYEQYFDRLIPEVAGQADLEPLVIGVGPRSAFRRRGARARLGEWLSLGDAETPYLHVNRFVCWRTFLAVRDASAEMRRLYGRLRKSPALQQVFAHRGVRFEDLAEPDLAGTLLLQVPWAVRCYEEMSAVLLAARPAVTCLYAESSGWGRAAVAASKALGVPTLGVQHGILYPKYYSYRHDADEAECPRPDRTAVFGDAAKRFLVMAGRYAPDSLRVTGSPKFDELLAASRQWDRAAIRAGFGVRQDQQLLAVASRFQGIRDTHQSIGTAFAPLLRAVEAMPRARLLVKPHPAEPTTGYLGALAAERATRAALVADADLMRLLFAADLLITVESLSAVEALVLDRPVVVLNMPTNLREMVEAGAALGVERGADPRPALEAVLGDEATRARLARGRREYLEDVASGVDGRATERVLALIRETLQLPPEGGPVAGGVIAS